MGSSFNIKMSFYQYKKSYYGDKTLSWQSYLHNWISYTDNLHIRHHLNIESRPRFSCSHVSPGDLCVFIALMILHKTTWYLVYGHSWDLHKLLIFYWNEWVSHFHTWDFNNLLMIYWNEWALDTCYKSLCLFDLFKSTSAWCNQILCIYTLYIMCKRSYTYRQNSSWKVYICFRIRIYICTEGTFFLEFIPQELLFSNNFVLTQYMKLLKHLKWCS